MNYTDRKQPISHNSQLTATNIIIYSPLPTNLSMAQYD